jgi:hypothetical protein
LYTAAGDVSYAALPASEHQHPPPPPKLSEPIDEQLHEQDSTRWRRELGTGDTLLREQLEVIYEKEGLGTRRKLIGWKDREAFGDFFFHVPDLIPAGSEAIQPKRKEAIAQVVLSTAADTRGLGPKWVAARQQHLRHFYDELHRKLNEERVLLQQHRASAHLISSNGEDRRQALQAERESIQQRKVEVNADIVRAKELLQSTQHSLENNRHYNVQSLLMFSKMTLVMLVLLVFSSMLSLDLTVLVISFLVVSVVSVWGFVLARSLRTSSDWRLLGLNIPAAWLVKRSLALYAVVMIVVTAGFFVLCLWRSLVYNYGTGNSKNITLAFLWLVTGMLFAMTLFTVSILSVRRTVVTWMAYVTLPAHTSVAQKSLGPKRE